MLENRPKRSTSILLPLVRLREDRRGLLLGVVTARRLFLRQKVLRPVASPLLVGHGVICTPLCSADHRLHRRLDHPPPRRTATGPIRGLPFGRGRAERAWL